MAPRLLEFADELRSEGMAVGTSELLDAFAALRHVSWTNETDFREALATTLAKSQEDRHVLELVFDRFFFRAVEREAIERELGDAAVQDGGRRPDRPRRAARADPPGAPGRRYAGRRDPRPRAAGDRRLRPPGRGLGRDRRRRPADPAHARPEGREPGAGAGRPRRGAARAAARVRAPGAARARAGADRAHAGPAALAPAARVRPRAADRRGPGPGGGPPYRRPAAQAARQPGPREPRAQQLGRGRRAPHDARLAADRRRAGRAALPPAPPAAARALHPLRRLDLGHERERLLPVRPARPARLVPQDALVRVRRADLRGHRGVRARAILRGRLARDRERRRRGRHLGLHRLRPRLDRVLRPGGRRPRSALDGDRARRRADQRPRAARRGVRHDRRPRRADVLDEPRAEALLELRRLRDAGLRATLQRGLRMLDHEAARGLRERPDRPARAPAPH